jgi:hypothetical protein
MVPSPNASTTLGDNELNGVSCVTSSFCVAAGYANNGSFNQTLAEQWNGKTWSIVPSPNSSTSQDNQFNDVACATSSFCMAAGSFSNGSQDQTLVEQWNGTAWSIIASPNTSASLANDLNGVSCLTPSFCVAAGSAYSGTVYQTLVEQWNGSVWSIVSSPNASAPHDNQFNDVACVTSSFCEAVGYAGNGSNNQTLVEQWNGTSWSIVSSPNTSSSQPNDLNGVSCVTGSFCVAVGFAGVSSSGHIVNLVEQWNGSTWSIVSVPDANAAFGDVLIAVDCSGPTSCVAGGYVNTIDNTDNTYVSEALTFNGSSWALVSIPEPAATAQLDQINSLSCVPGVMCVGVGYATFGSNTNEQTLALSAPITRPGYYLVASDGGIFTHGGAPFYGSTGNITLNKPIVGMAVTPDGGGYWLVASDGGIFTKGDASFFGSLGNIVLNKPIVGMASTPDGQGYWLVASDGGIFTKGDAGFFGSTGNIVLNKPIVGMAATPDGLGYWLVASDGGIFTKGDAAFAGSEGGTKLNKPIVGMAA